MGRMKEYHARIDGGEGGHTTIRAGTMKAALKRAVQWTKDGDWEYAQEHACATGRPEKARLEVWKGERDEYAGDARYREVDVTVAHPKNC